MSEPETEESVVTEVIEACGGLQETARKCSVSYQAVQKWRKSGKVPAERILVVERASGVPREKLRPDLYARETRRPSKVARRIRA